MTDLETQTLKSHRGRRSNSHNSITGSQDRKSSAFDPFERKATADSLISCSGDSLNSGTQSCDNQSTLVLISQRLGIDGSVIESLIKQISLRTIQEFNERSSNESKKVVVKEETPKSWLTRDQAAHLIGVSPKTISNWATQGKLRRHGLNGSSRGLARYFRADVESVIEKKGTKK
jgi:hypothetical protein